MSISALPTEDLHHLKAAEGWLELGNHLEANEELEEIQASFRAHPSVLLLRWDVYAMAKKWELCVDIAKALVKMTPDHEQCWINLGKSLHSCNQTQDAYDCLKSVANRFAKSALLRYQIACYSTHLGNLQEARSWLEKAFELDPSRKMKLTALEDPDLEPLWKNIGGL